MFSGRCVRGTSRPAFIGKFHEFVSFLHRVVDTTWNCDRENKTLLNSYENQSKMLKYIKSQDLVVPSLGIYRPHQQLQPHRR